MCKISSNYIKIIGPTASGKSSLAMNLATKLSSEIVACDSVQVYRGFDVGSAKPNLNDQSKITHHMLDCVGGNESFDASSYKEKARVEFTNKLRPILEKFAKDNSISIILKKENLLIGRSNLDATKNILDLFNKDIKKLKIE